MKKQSLNLFTFAILFPILLFGQIPKGHFIDADETVEKGYKVKPFKQVEEGIYHYAVLTELPFENDCSPELSEKEQISCSESHLRELIYQQLNSEINFAGNVYVYFTVTKEADISNMSVKSYPESKVVNNIIKDVIHNIKVKAGKYNGDLVNSRLWTSFTFPSSSKALFSESLTKMLNDKNSLYEDYENLIFDACQYVFSNPIYPNSKELIAATQIVSFWMNKDTGMNIPTFGDFYDALTNKERQQFLYVVAMIHYGLDQKINHNRILKCAKVEGQKYSEQEDVREVQLEGAKLLLAFIGNEQNNVPMNSKAKKYLKALNNGQLAKLLFK